MNRMTGVWLFAALMSWVPSAALSANTSLTDIRSGAEGATELVVRTATAGNVTTAALKIMESV